ncbi:MAG: DNA-3-methyladenine glycosylase 2 family protein [Clostridia bacterium]|nr:DNA-3-methyladenine glycosylase 2 family protein [Clostridia bacterium]
MEIKAISGGVTITGLAQFNLKHIFDCGQCFRWVEQDDGSYIGVAAGKVIKVTSHNNNITIFNTSLQEFFDVWENYFDLKTDYASYQKKLSIDTTMKTAITSGEGIRILRQDTFEALISFIISASNNIPRIMKIVDSLCRLYGDKLEFEGKEYYTFPTAEKLKGITEEDLAPIKSGFRAKYIVDAVNKVCSGEIDFSKIKDLDAISAQKYLMQISGVGPKVADCVLIFGCGRLDVFPVDTWIDKAMKSLYPAACEGVKVREAGINLFGEICGLAQQYIFYYARENKIKI